VRYTDVDRLKTTLDSLLSSSRELMSLAQTGQAQTLSMEDNGTVAVNEDNNTLIIRATPDDMERLVALVNELDQPRAQVLIEAHIVETTQEVARELGVQWGGLVSTSQGYITPGSNTTGIDGVTLVDPTTGALLPLTPTTGTAGNFPAALGADGEGLTLGYVYERLGERILSVQLSALEQDSKLNILSSPSITTLDNEVATIESGTEVPYQTRDEEGEVTVAWKDAVLKLEVTPHVIDDKVVKLKIETSKDELDFNRAVQGNPTIIKKKAMTTLLLHDGQTTVIGGLTKEDGGRGATGVPFLKDIPLLGHLFKSSSRDSRMEEMLIFITPHVLSSKATATTVTPADTEAAATGPVTDPGE
jgi:type IV pilus assembly protein PilQ